MEIIVPKPNMLEDGTVDIWPTLGPQICNFIESRFVYGPGSLKGEPYVVRDDFRYLLYRLYEHYPEGYKETYGTESRDLSGRRRFQKGIISLPKGSAKCLAPDTMLSLETGESVRADEVKPGQSVQSYLDGEVVYRPVAAVEPQPAVENYLVKTTDGREITVSEGHPFLVSGDWKKVENLHVGDPLTSVSEGVVGSDRVLSVDAVGERETIGIEIEDTHVHVTNGLVTHNTELMAIVALLELHPDAPIRFAGYDDSAEGGLAPGRSVMSPFIPLLAPTLEQLKDLAYGAAMEIVKDIDDAALFDPNKERIMINGEGESKIIPVAASAGRLDGQKPTFQGIDESHRMVEDRHIAAVTTIENNLKKRFADDPWQLSTTTAGDPSEPSMALREFQYGMKIAEGKIKDPTTFFYHRATSDENAKFDTMENRIKALKEASGPEAAKFRDLFSVAKEWDDENADHSYLERVWCNRWVQSSTSAFDAKKFRELGDESLKIAPGSTIVLGFDGAISDDSTALVATEIETGIQNLVGIWEKPEGATRWQVPVGEVNAVMEDMFEFYDVLKLYADPPYWQESISKWAGRWEKRVVEWPTRNETHIYYALRAYSEAINMGEVGHDNNQALIDHIAASGKNLLNRYDDEGKQKYRLAKRQRDKKIDAAMAAVLSWQARLDALSEGAQEEEEQYVPRRIR